MKEILITSGILITVASLVIFFLSGCNQPQKKTSLPAPIPIISVDSLAENIALTRTRLNALNDDSGKFLYRFNLDSRKTYPPQYNLLRHCGAIYALSELQIATPDSITKKTIRQSLKMLQNYLKEVPDQKGLMGVWEAPEKNFPIAKLGGTGLGLASAAMAYKVGIKTISLDTLREMGNFLRYLQKEDGSFYSKYHVKNDLKDDQWESLYYPGEAALGWLLLSEVDTEAVWDEYANRALLYLAASRKDDTIVPADHWALISLKRLFEHRPTMDSNQKQLHIDHAVQIVTGILAEQRTNGDLPKSQIGSFDLAARTTPAATRLEGLLAAYAVIPDTMISLRVKMDNAVAWGVSYLIRAQVKEGIYAGAIPRSVYKLSDSIPGADDVNRRRNEVRVDYLQHALSAMQGYHTYLSRQK